MVAVDSLTMAQKSSVLMASYSAVCKVCTSARGPRWKHPGGRSGTGVAEGLASFGQRCLPFPGALSPYKEIVVESVAHLCL